MPARRQDSPYYGFALVLGAAAGYVHLQVQDPTLAALMVTAFAMFLGVLRPQRPWRWALLVALCLPGAELLSFLSRVKPQRGAVFGAFVALIPGFVAAYGGSFLRRMVANVFEPSAGSEHSTLSNQHSAPERHSKKQ